MSVKIRLGAVCDSDQQHLQEATPHCLCKGTQGRSGTLGRRTGLSQSPPSYPHSSGTGTWIWSVHTCTTVCFRKDTDVIYLNYLYSIVWLELTAMRLNPWPDFENCFVNIDIFAVNAELEVSCLWVVKLFLQRLRHGQEVIMLWREKRDPRTHPHTSSSGFMNYLKITFKTETGKTSFLNVFLMRLYFAYAL